MKTILVVLLACFACTLSHAQIQVGLWTDKSTYVYGDTVAMTVTAYNPGADTVVLHFPSSCQVSYTIDNFSFINHTVCATVLTSRTILPHGTIQWDYLKYPASGSGWPLLALGSHTITGQVLGYATSDTLTLFVTPTVSVTNVGIETRGFLLDQNYPNPFNGTTMIPFTVSSAERALMTLYNILGQRIRTLLDEYRTPGVYTVRAELNDLPSGSYWCRLQIGAKNQTIKLILSK